MTKGPNFFIVGAPKCGTTALFDYLRTHPQICMPPVSRKEPHFFADDLPGMRDIGPNDSYEDLFKLQTSETRAIGEASVFYLYSQVAISNILQYTPDARLIVMLRNPIQACYSMHAQLLFSADENESNFETAWDLQEKRARGEQLPPTCREPALLQYQQLFSLGAQVERALKQVPREQMLILLFDDWAAQTRREYQRVLEFLRVDDDGREQFPRVNASKQHRWRWLGTFTSHPPAWLQSVVRKAQRLLGVDNLGLSRWIQRKNQQPFQRAPLSPAMRQKLVEAFSDDIALLSEVTGRDLAHWTANTDVPST